ncbi:hypothetical protein ACC797_24390, partial [Rhizobium ruizarguesonis]
GCGRPKHQEDRNGAHHSVKTSHGVSRYILLHLCQNTTAKKIQSAKTKPAEKSTGLSAVWRRRKAPFSVGARG